MPFRIETKLKVPDARSVSKCGFFNSLGLKNKVKKVEIVDCYTVDAKMSFEQQQRAALLLTNNLLENYSITSNFQFPISNFQNKNFDFAIEISFLPGVTDNVGHTAKETLEDGTGYKFKNREGIYSSVVYFIGFNTTSLPLRGISPRQGRKKMLADATIIADSLYNPLIQKAVIKSFREYFNSPTPPTPSLEKRGKNAIGFPPNLPKVQLASSNKITKIDLNVSDEELVAFGKFGILDKVSSRPRPSASEGASRDPEFDKKLDSGMTHRRGPLALSLEYLHSIRDYFNTLKRKPTDIEIETLAQTWSEHCKHTIFADPIDNLKQGLYKTYIKGATEAIRKQKHKRDFCVSVFTDNAGGIIFDKNYLVTHKVETHNTPSSLDPFGGSITGIVGVNRDALGFGLGAKPIINTFGFCLAKPTDKTELYRHRPVGNGRDRSLQNNKPMLSARRIMDGVVSGINSGGNQSGIPTNSGFMYFDDRYRGKPLVFAGTVGLIPRKINNKLSHIKQAKDGDFIVMVGGRVGLDGIHGATFSSEGLDAHSPATAVQIGDPITQKKFSDAICKEARGMNLFNSITDCGAGGLSSAVGEMASQSNGCLVGLEKVPVKYPGLAPWQIWISESQERMVLAVPPKKWTTLQKLLRRRGVESSVIGKFTSTGKCQVKFGKQMVLDMELDFLHNGRPKRFQISDSRLKIPKKPTLISKKTLSLNLKSLILNLLSSPNIASTAFLATQYDHEVQGGSVLKPLQGKGRVNADATITKPLLNSPKGIVLSSALYPSYSEIDPYNMAGCAIDSAIRQAVCAGANPDYLALLDNFCWCSPEDPNRLWQLKEAVRGCYDFATAFGTPFISGKDSMHNDFKGFDDKGKAVKISIPPTLLISAIGVVDDVNKTVSLDAKLPEDIIYILGETDGKMGGSEYELMTRPVGNGLKPFPTLPTPVVDATLNYSLYKSLYKAIQKKLIASAISIGRGGLITALSKMLIAGNLGAKINLEDLPGDWNENHQALFSEDMGRILVSINPKLSEQFESAMIGNAFAKLGKTTKHSSMIIHGRENRKIVNLKISQMTKAYQSTLKYF